MYLSLIYVVNKIFKKIRILLSFYILLWIETISTRSFIIWINYNSICYYAYILSNQPTISWFYKKVSNCPQKSFKKRSIVISLSKVIKVHSLAQYSPVLVNINYAVYLFLVLIQQNNNVKNEACSRRSSKYTIFINGE